MAGDVDEILADYTEESTLITPQGVIRGTSGIRAFFADVLRELPDAALDVPVQLFDGDVLFITWSATSTRSRVTDGVDTFVFGDDGIRVQTVRATFAPM
jgi:predicted SnoaL-like aldol condensation-catalyzing enzyme